MVKQTLYFGNPLHLNTENNQLTITNKESGKISQLPIEDIGFAVLEHPHISIMKSAIKRMA